VAASLRPLSWAIRHTEFNAGVLRLRPDSDRGSKRPYPHLRPRRGRGKDAHAAGGF